MIDDKKIEEAATVASISDTEKGRVREGYVINALADHENGFREGYIEGAKWAIQEFLKDLWHKASETPDLNRRILYEYKPNGEINPPTHIREATYEKMRWKECGYKPINPERIITRWLYIDDLFKKEGGEQ